MTEKQNPKEAVKAALAPIMQDMIAVDRILREELTTSQSEIIAKVGNYIVEAGGKRMRPALLMLMARALGYEGTLHQELGATIEMLHTATLMHDDVVDEGMMRRGRPTANAQWGNNVAVLVGDFMYTRSFQMMVRIGNLKVMEALAGAANTLSEGEVIQMKNAHDPSVDEKRYFEVIERKTSVLFSAAARMAAAIANAAPEQEQGLVSNCSSLTSVAIPDSVTSIGDWAFYYCSSLTSVVIGDSVTSIGEYAFSVCDSLTSVVIPDSVMSIGSYAFEYCYNLTSVVIGDSVTKIGSYAFEKCSSLTNVYYKGSGVHEWNWISIGWVNDYLTNAERYYYSESQPTASGNYWHYDENGKVVVW